MSRELGYSRWTILIIWFFSLSLGVYAQQDSNPAAEGFDAAGSDAKAITVADEVMEKMGGRANWDNTRYVTWKFFGRRMHVWDKWTGDIRVEAKDLTVLMNIHSMEGRAWENGTEISDPDTLKNRLQYGKSAWINDSYWMFLPYKLKDSGVTLLHKGDGETTDGRAADILQLTFKGVGDTPDNKYLVYVDKETRLLTQWDFYTNFGDEAPRFSTPWQNWQDFSGILLSDDRGRNKHTEINVFKMLPESVFKDPAAVNFSSMK